MLLSIPSIYWHPTLICIFSMQNHVACIFFSPNDSISIDKINTCYSLSLLFTTILQ